LQAVPAWSCVWLYQAYKLRKEHQRLLQQTQKQRTLDDARDSNKVTQFRNGIEEGKGKTGKSSKQQGPVAEALVVQHAPTLVSHPSGQHPHHHHVKDDHNPAPPPPVVGGSLG
jgi:hypothetical protein